MVEFTSSDHLFEGKDPEVRKIHDALLKAAKRLGPFAEEPKKTCIHLAAKSAFLGIHPRKSSVMLTIRSGSPIESGRIRKREQVSKNRCHNDLVLESAKEVDAELIGWMREAYKLSE